jgi:hypothetical protein
MCGLRRSAQAIFFRRRHQARRPPLAKIRPGRPAPAMGPDTLGAGLMVRVMSANEVTKKLCDFWTTDSYGPEERLLRSARLMSSPQGVGASLSSHDVRCLSAAACMSFCCSRTRRRTRGDLGPPVSLDGFPLGWVGHLHQSRCSPAHGSRLRGQGQWQIVM